MPTIRTRLPSGSTRAVQLSIARDDVGAARGEFRGAMRGLLGKGGEADADQPSVGLALPLPLADFRHVQQIRRRAARSPG